MPIHSYMAVLPFLSVMITIRTICFNIKCILRAQGKPVSVNITNYYFVITLTQYQHPPNIIRVTKSRRMRGARHVACVEEKKRYIQDFGGDT